jgi:hypothetical protein
VGGAETGYLGRIDTSPVTSGEDKVIVGLYMVKITLVLDFLTWGIRDKDGEGIDPQIYESSFVIGDSGGPKIGEPIICIFLTVGVDELRCDTRDW